MGNINVDRDNMYVGLFGLMSFIVKSVERRSTILCLNDNVRKTIVLSAKEIFLIQGMHVEFPDPITFDEYRNMPDPPENIMIYGVNEFLRYCFPIANVRGYCDSP